MNGKVLIARDDFLSHHGTDGMRWGVRNGPPYPLTKEGRAAIRKQLKERRAAQKAEAERKLQIKKEKEEAKFKAEREKMVMSVSAEEAMKHQGKWTNDELRRIADRLDLEARISSKIPRKKTVLSKLSLYNNYAREISNLGKSGLSIYKTINGFYKESRKGNDEKADKEEKKEKKDKNK